MSKKKAAPSDPAPKKRSNLHSAKASPRRLVLSTGCPAGIGPEISVRAAVLTPSVPPVLVGDFATLLAAAEMVGIRRDRFVRLNEHRPGTDTIPVLQAGPALSPKDRRPGKPSRASGTAQLAYIDAGYRLTNMPGFGGLVTAPVNKASIFGSGAPGAKRFIGHTEWLEQLDGAPFSVMCFYSPRLTSALVTTHLPLARVPRAITAAGVCQAIVSLAGLLRRLGHARAKVAVCSLNPHASEAGMFGREEELAIGPGMQLAEQRLGRSAEISGPIGAETAFRKAYAGDYAGVVAMYHDQATIPMKLVAFGDAVNVTLGLSIDRTSVDHGTAYDIAWKNQAEITGIQSALALAERLAAAPVRPAR